MSTRTNGQGPAGIVTRPANGSYHPSRMNHPGTRPTGIKPPVTLFTTTGIPAGSIARGPSAESRLSPLPAFVLPEGAIYR
jgi:hypothetical protein